MEEKYNILFAEWIEGKISDKELQKKVPNDIYVSFQKVKKGLNVYAELEKPIDKSWKELQQKLEVKKRKTNPKYIRLIASAVSVAAVLLLYFGVNKFFNEEIIRVQTALAEHKTYVLPDGSEVVLNENSRISFDKAKWKSKRNIKLEGEAFFKVKKGSSFTVKTNKGTVKTIGTQFDVKSINDIFDVLCYQGKVKVKIFRLDKELFLPAGSGIKTNLDVINNVAIANETAPYWIHKYEIFEHKSLQIVLNEIEKIYSVTFDASNININKNFSGKIPTDNLHKALQIVLKPMEINYKIKNDSIILFNEKNPE